MHLLHRFTGHITHILEPLLPIAQHHPIQCLVSHRMYAFATSFIPALRLGHSPSVCAVRPRVAAGMRAARMVISLDDINTAVRITGNNVQITESLREHVREKLRKVIRKYSGLLTGINVHLKVEHNPAISARHKAEVIVFAGKNILRAEVSSADMYAAIDLVEERIVRTIRKFKERKTGRSRKSSVEKSNDVALGGAVMTPELDVEDGGMEDVYADVGRTGGVPPVNEIVRRKKFPMPKQSVADAILCCEYLDHSWYMFRNEVTNRIALVYKRNAGGYGLIEPDE